MGSIVEKTAQGGYIYKPAKTMEVPNLDLITLLFDSEICNSPDSEPVHLDADDPTHRYLTKGELRREAQRTAAVFRSQFGIGASGPNKDVVCAIATGHFMLPCMFYATVMADGIFSSSSPSCTPEEFAFQLRQTSGKMILCTPETVPIALKAASLVGLPASRVLVIGGARRVELVEAGPGGARVPMSNVLHSWRRIMDPAELRTSIICLLFSSGTTGLPKAMRLSHLNSVSAAYLNLEDSRAYYEAREPDRAMATLAHLPAAHIAGVQSYFANCLYMGGKVYWMAKFDFAKFLTYAERYRVNSMFTVPPIYLLIAKSPLVKDQLRTWDDAVAGAAPMGEDLQIEAAKKLGAASRLSPGAVQLRQTWGLSETTGSITVVPIDVKDAPAGCVGSLVASCYARIVDDDGADVEPGKEGEIWVKGPVVTEGYWRNDAANAGSFKDGWFCTGDIGVFRDGWFWIVDRKKELIKYKGNQVAPAELEALLISHPKILDAAVIGVEGEGTEVPRAYVVVADPKQTSDKEIVDWVKGQVARHKQLRGGVVFLEAIPKSPSGKILRRTLREMAKKESRPSKL